MCTESFHEIKKDRRLSPAPKRKRLGKERGFGGGKREPFSRKVPSSLPRQQKDSRWFKAWFVTPARGVWLSSCRATRPRSHGCWRNRTAGSACCFRTAGKRPCKPRASCRGPARPTKRTAPATRRWKSSNATRAAGKSPTSIRWNSGNWRRAKWNRLRPSGSRNSP